jgi:hypothetical protein
MIASAGQQVVVIASVPMVSTLRAQHQAEPNTRVFSEADFLLALEAILSDVPEIIALDPDFAATARGAALVARVKADPRLRDSEVRALVQNGTYDASLSAPIQPESRAPATVFQPLDYCGTRRAARYAMKGVVEARINGAPGQLINLSVTGAQVVAQIRMRPTEKVRLALTDATTELRLTGAVAWANLEISARGVQQYRAGLELCSADEEVMERYCQRNRQA